MIRIQTCCVGSVPWLALFGLVAASGLLEPAACFAALPADQVEFFEDKIRPVLAEHCYGCHNSLKRKEGGLALDYKAALLAGGDSGEAIESGEPAKSLLIKALRHQDGYEMPANAPQLQEEVIRDFERWVKMGAPDPRINKPTEADLKSSKPWEEIREERRKWWAFQPVRAPEIPAVTNPEWNNSPLDRFVYAGIEQAGLKPQALAAPEVLVRRVHLLLTGLPPEPEAVAQFVVNPNEAAYEELVDKLLASNAFGERWARHWMDWYRYCESHGSEGDPRIPYASEYRDYLIRALNADVPYDQLIREHLAGDLLPNPRINRELRLNESAIGPAHFRMVPHGFGVTDAYDEQITFTDNQIDVISKAMLGVTVSCARCHDHKFDPISQKDFYRLYGIMISSRPSTVLIDSPERLETNKQALTQLKVELRDALAKHWLNEVEELDERLNQLEAEQHYNAVTHPFAAWFRLKEAPAAEYPQRWERMRTIWQEIQRHNKQVFANAEFYVDLRDPEQVDQWFTTGNGTHSVVSPAGSFAIAHEGGQALRGIYPRGIYSHLLSDKHAGVLSTANFVAKGKGTFVRFAGESAQLRVPIRNYALTHGGLHPATNIEQQQRPAWLPAQRKWNYWQGEKLHYEFRTSRDIIPNPGNQDRSWFGVSEIYAGDDQPQDEGASLLTVLDETFEVKTKSELVVAYQTALRNSISQWRAGTMSDQQAEFLDTFVRADLLTNQITSLPADVKNLVDRYRKLEQQVPVPRRAPGVIDAEPVDQPLLARGNYKQEREPVARQFLELYAERTYGRNSSGRLELANDLLSNANPLKSRVLVNRLWAYVFGRGIVASTDNFGRLGNQPTHPELLDHLALQFERDGWSIKRLLKTLVTSRAFKSSSFANEKTRLLDPNNTFLSYYTPRRLDAEAIYDSVLKISNRDGRAVYLPVIRNRLHPFMTTFNAPVPTSTVSFRTNTNVPAQSLAMLNGELVERTAITWSARIKADEALRSPADKITAMFRQALAREPSAEELRLLIASMHDTGELETAMRELGDRGLELDAKLGQLRESRADILEPARARLLAERQQPSNHKPVDLQPFASWDFEEDADDQVGNLRGELKGSAHVEDGALVLNGGCLMTAPLRQALSAKTLEVIVQLDDLDQRGGGAMTVQTLDGNLFDSIVYGEAISRKWLAGSDHFRRTVPLEGPSETEAIEKPVHLTITYDEGGKITAYRNGEPYGASYRKAPAQPFAANQCQVVFGLRHGRSPSAGRMLTGKIFEARLYNRALSAEEVATAVEGTHQCVTRSMVLKALSPEQQQVLKKLEAKLSVLEAEAAELAQQKSELESQLRKFSNEYYSIAHALLNAKEFIYVY